MTFKPAAWPRKLRSQEWFGGDSRDHIYHRSWMKNQGLPADLFDGRPVIGICNTWSQLTPCNAHLRDLAERVKHGIYEAGGLPLEFPVFSTGESALRPTAMMYRNLAAMDVEEAIRANPLDGVVLLCGCDKTTPALLMGAASVDLPAIMVSGGPMMNGWFRGERVGSGTALWQMSEDIKAGKMTREDFLEAEQAMSRSPGSCNTMGTASSMASMVEALGMALSGNAAIPAVDSRRRVMSHVTGRRIVQMVKDDLKPSDVLTREAFQNAIRTNGAIGGSTNAVIHLMAIAGRVGIDLTLDDWDTFGRDVPTIVNLMPSGKYLMEEFFYAGGLPVVIKRLGEAGLLNRDALTVSGDTAWDQVKDAVNHNEDVIRPAGEPLAKQGGIAVLRGNLAPKGAVLKPSAASPHLLTHRGRAVVFEDIDDYKARINDDDLDIDETCVMVLKMCGPRGYPGMSEVGNMGLPPKVLKKGITDMVRISDARMSGTAYGTVILHTSPEAAAGGPLAIVQDGDMIELDMPNRRLHLDVPDAEIARRLAAWENPVVPPASGYARLFHDHVQGADTGADFDFLVGCRGNAVPRDSH
ncbi:L-arabinonate dehydratase [Pseudosulfitobacter pseudonitzschiae]|uniref:L-arabinonate dehydratase n=1 Tax=Pseudosulfitobacter pseudonitzschiae TaxID=1402135 RepID=UPI001AFB42ED|nr:L-arabinonate dehydratase [Pseudosulfitobacter pseudonitzschiae]MBM1817740.1 dihydroxy-acid dehydratase [Pseudosulfitobacter pseudonitzschiae]MBM1834735.1 dihydroxy-acid dehydratase [Pseudosulfitobacter pseudonitzschiae]MBM1839599.1 dihydroxy-acid dehydratase [Pseudosulfitobacter pseudonitzschiae]MBM1844450.1 dihydroxy-acid dehydratase [Pseudosulfitobacter pseudonitzschiae]MBM1849284.1 dihydroxy-acid dehydratase [Pseudosulfitobacter pseudonitzschiae]